MTEREALAARLDCYAYNFDVDHAAHVISDLKAAAAELRAVAQVPRTEITREMALAGRKALAAVADRMEEAKLLATTSIDFWQRVGHEPANEIYAAMVAASPLSPPTQEGGE